MRSGERVVGVLCTYNRGGLEGFEEGEVAILEALANEVAGAIEKSELLAAILDERSKLSTIVESTSDGILTLDAEGTITSWNHGFEDITGYLDTKLAALREHHSQIKKGQLQFFEQWMPLDADEAGRLVGVQHAEQFRQLQR